MNTPLSQCKENNSLIFSYLHKNFNDENKLETTVLFNEIEEAFNTSALTIKTTAVAIVTFFATKRICFELVNQIAIPIILLGLQSTACIVPVAAVATITTIVSTVVVLQQWKTKIIIANVITSMITSKYFPKIELYVRYPVSQMLRYTVFLPNVVAFKCIQFSYNAATYLVPDVKILKDKISNSIWKYCDSNLAAFKKNISPNSKEEKVAI